MKEILPKALDSETFGISSKRLQNQDLVDCTLVDQTSTASCSRTNELLSPTEARTIAIVDRTTDIDKAARDIVTARFGFQGMSPYAPDIVIVNEFVKPQFFAACTRYASQAFAAQGSVTRPASNSSEKILKAIREAEEKRQLSCFGSSSFMIVDIAERLFCPRREFSTRKADTVRIETAPSRT